jgi:hypothetical protein
MFPNIGPSLPDTRGRNGNAAGTMRAASQHAWLPLTLAGLVLVGYPWALAANHTDAESAGRYIAAVRHADIGGLFDPGRLLYAGPNGLLYKAWQGLGYRGDPALPMQLLNVLAAAAAMFLVVRLGQRLGLDDFHVLIAAGLTGTAYGFWWHGVEVDPYMLPLPLILLCVAVLVHLATGEFGLWPFVALGCASALAVLLVRQHILLLPILAVAVCAIWHRRCGEVSGAKLARGLAVYAGVATVLVVGAYMAAAIFAHGCAGPGECIAWSVGPAYDGPSVAAAPVETLADVARTVCGLHFLYGFDSFADAVAREFPAKFLADNRFLAESIPAAVRWLCLGTFIAVFVAGWIVIAGCLWPRRWVAWRRPPCDTSMRRNPHCFAFGAFALLTLFVYATVNVLCGPPGVGRWIVLVPLGALFVGMRLAGWPRGRWASWAAVALVAAAYLTNLCGSVLPQASHQGDYWYAANEDLIRQAKPDDLILTDGGWLSDNCLRAHTAARILVVREHSPEELAGAIREHRDGRILVSSWAETPDPRLLAAATDWQRDEKGLAPLFASFRGRLVRLDENAYQIVWKLAQE